MSLSIVDPLTIYVDNQKEGRVVWEKMDIKYMWFNF